VHELISVEDDSIMILQNSRNNSPCNMASHIRRLVPTITHSTVRTSNLAFKGKLTYPPDILAFK
jgi:hypothetical protein